MWRGKWKADATLAASLDTPIKALAHNDSDIFPNIQVLLRIMDTLLVISCECERSISMMRLVKSQLRTTMGQTRLNSLALLYYHHRAVAMVWTVARSRYSRAERPQNFGLMNINKLIIVNNSVIDRARQLKIFMMTSQYRQAEITAHVAVGGDIKAPFTRRP